MKTIKVSYMPGTPVEVIGTDEMTVAEAIAQAEFDATGYSVKVDGVETDVNTTITAGAQYIILAKKVKGNAPCEIKVSYMPGTPVPFLFDTPKTVAEVLEAVGMDAEGYSIKLDGVEVSLDTQITDGNYLILAKKVKGNK